MGESDTPAEPTGRGGGKTTGERNESATNGIDVGLVASPSSGTVGRNDFHTVLVPDGEVRSRLERNGDSSGEPCPGTTAPRASPSLERAVASLDGDGETIDRAGRFRADDEPVLGTDGQTFALAERRRPIGLRSEGVSV